MFEIQWHGREQMFKETEQCYSEIEGIDEIRTIQTELFGSEAPICFGDATIDGLAYPAAHDMITVYICYYINCRFRGREISAIHYAIDFYEPDIFCFDIEFNTHWIDDVFIQKNTDGKYSITFGSGELDFRYSHAKVNRCWGDCQKA